MNETSTQRLIQEALSTHETRLFRNQVGSAWVSNRETKLDNGDIILHNPRRISYGLCVGSSDLIGPRSRIIAPEDVGTRVAVFSAVEVKSADGRLTTEQNNFINTIRFLGGYAGVARNIEQAKRILFPEAIPE